MPDNLLCVTPEGFTLSNTRQFYSSKGDPLGVNKRVNKQFWEFGRIVNIIPLLIVFLIDK